VKQVCSNCEVLFSTAKQDAEQQTQAATAIAAGVSAIVLDPVHGAAGAAIVTQAKAANIPVIAFDQKILNTADVNYYVSFDTEGAGGLEATAMLAALGGKVNPTIVEIDGDATDANTDLFKKSALAALGKVKIARQYETPGGSALNAKTEMEHALKDLNFRVDGVLAASDRIAGGAVAVMKGNVRPWPPVTGQGAELAAIQRIVAGDQYMTLYMGIKAEAEAAAQLAYDLAFGVTVPNSMTNGKTVNNGSADIPSVLVAPQVVTKANIESTVVADGFWNADEICTTQYISACAAAGIG
jgi:D-xylose transport system substrate-binding protein